MPSVNYNGQSFAIDSRRHWIVGAAIEYARTEPSSWKRSIEQARDAGFNTILTSCPWALHEPRPNRFTFEGPADVRRFVTLCGEAGMRVILRPGPYVGSGFDGGGLPAWLAEIPGIALREQNEAFLERVITYLRRLISQIDDLQASRTASRSMRGSKAEPAAGGPIILVQSEHAWLCSNPKQAEGYLRELSRVLRESGVTVPLINANDLWQESPGTIDTWRGYEDLLVHLRQLRSFEQGAPLLVSDFKMAKPTVWGASDPALDPPALVMRRLGECLAAGGQPVVNPFAGGTNFGFLGGRLAGAADRFVTSSAAAGAMLAEDGSRTERYAPLRRLLMFANHFGHVFAELDPLDHPISLDVAATEEGGRNRSAKAAEPYAAVIPLRGSQGRVVFVFAGEGRRSLTLVLDDGIRMPVHLGDQDVGWLVFDADLAGAGRLDYANLFPFAIVERSLLILQGPAGCECFVSVGGAPLHAQVPTGEKPLVLPHKGLHVVICNQQQINAAHIDSASGVFYVGASGLDEEGRVIPEPEFGTVWMITRDGAIDAVAGEQLSQSAESTAKRRQTKSAPKAPRPKLIAPSNWKAASADAYTRGESPRYATTGGPCSLNGCGAPTGYGWYRVSVTSSSARKQLCHLPGAADRAHLFVDGEPIGVVGVGAGARPAPFELRLTKGEHRIVALVDNMGRFADGNDLDERKGIFEHVFEIKPLRSIRPKQIKADPIDPFALRGYIALRTAGQRSDGRQIAWAFAHTRKSPILLDVQGAKISGTFLLNDVPIAYFAGETGSGTLRLLLSRDHFESFKRGKNVLRFAPDARQDHAIDDITKHTTLFECTETISDNGTWAFAKWEPPPTTLYEAVAPTAGRKLRGTPCWWTATFLVPERLEPTSFCLEMKGLSKGQAYINGHNLGRYFTATATGKQVGPQTRLHVPLAWINREGENEIIIFDEHGFDPFKCRVICGVQR